MPARHLPAVPSLLTPASRSTRIEAPAQCYEERQKAPGWRGASYGGGEVWYLRKGPVLGTVRNLFVTKHSCSTLCGSRGCLGAALPHWLIVRDCGIDLSEQIKELDA
ncbi:hypothetical protein NDU88_012334 [Pleurodeles waltl]|uniref:Uncharacterized protein n=1 Tax=Pleurodeles waltl TaxID=8319 RepID=A0AAV7QZU3_PLEWA|nr:hypothetical protein NDU88_012334 [Pleurodeles waltl]